MTSTLYRGGHIFGTNDPHATALLVDGDEVVSDSRRILQYLDWRYDGSE